MNRFLTFLLCRLRRHDPMVHVADTRIWLRCTECGYESPGLTWMLAPPAPMAAKVIRFVKRLAA